MSYFQGDPLLLRSDPQAACRPSPHSARQPHAYAGALARPNSFLGLFPINIRRDLL